MQLKINTSCKPKSLTKRHLQELTDTKQQNVLSLTSAAIFVATVAFYIRSYSFLSTPQPLQPHLITDDGLE